MKFLSLESLHKKVDSLLEKRDKLEEKCDTLPECKEDDSCATCQVYEQIEKIDQEIEHLELKIEDLTKDEED